MTPDPTDAGHAALILTTVASEADAARLARELVESRAAACVSVLPVRSTYRWRGGIEEESELLLLVKVAAGNVERARQAILARHPYEVPELLVLDATGVPEPYLRWLEGDLG